MAIEQLKEIFAWLEKEMNKQNLFYFKLIDENQIMSYFKNSGKPFATFYINQIIKAIEKEKN